MDASNPRGDDGRPEIPAELEARIQRLEGTLGDLARRMTALEGAVAARPAPPAAPSPPHRAPVRPEAAPAPAPRVRISETGAPDRLGDFLFGPSPAPLAGAVRLPRVEPGPAGLPAFRPTSPPREAEAPQAPTRPAGPAPTMEERIGGQWLNWLGAVTLVIAGALLFKWLYDIGFLTPLFRLPPIVHVALGWIAAAGLFALGLRERDRLPLLAQALTGSGIALGYIATYAGYGPFAVLGHGTTTAVLCLIAVAAIAASLRLDAQAICWLGVALAYLNPVVLRGASTGPGPLMTYLTALNLVVLAVSIGRAWTGFRLAAFLATAALYLGWHLRSFWFGEVPAALLFVGLNGLVFVAATASGPILSRRPGPREDVTLAVLNPLLCGAALYAILSVRHGDWLGMAMLAASGALYAVAAAIRRRRGEPDDIEQVLFAAALAFLLLAAPLHFRGDAQPLTVSWAAIGAALALAGFRIASTRLRGWGLAALALGIGNLVANEVQVPGALMFGFVSQRSLSFAAVVLGVAAAAATFAADRVRSERGREGPAVVLVALAFVAGWLIAYWSLLETPRSCVVAWCAAGALLLFYEDLLRRPGLHWPAVALLGAAALASVLGSLDVDAIPGADPHLSFLGATALAVLGAWKYDRWGGALRETGSVACAAAGALVASVYLGSRFDPWWSAAGPAIAGTVLLAAGLYFRREGLLWVGLTTLGGGLFYEAQCSLPPAQARDGGSMALTLAAAGGAAAAFTRLRPCEGRNLATGAAASIAAAAWMTWAYAGLAAGSVPLAWGLAAAVVLASACFTRLPSLRGLASAIAVAMLCEALARQLTVPAGSPLFLHERSLAMGLVIAALAGAVWLHGTQGPEVERPASVFLAVLAYLAGLLWLSLEGVDAAARAAAPAWQSEAAGFGLSAVWVLYAGASIAVGMWRDVRALRLGGLALLSLAVMKVYLFDLSFLATGWRVLSFLVLAVVLLLVSTIYQRAMPRRDAPPVPPPAGP